MKLLNRWRRFVDWCDAPASVENGWVLSVLLMWAARTVRHATLRGGMYVAAISLMLRVITRRPRPTQTQWAAIVLAGAVLWAVTSWL